MSLWSVHGDGYTIEATEFRIRAIHTPGHASNHLCYLLEEERTLFSGDHIMDGSTVVIAPPDGDMAAYMASLSRLLEREDRIYYPAHGPAIERPHKWVRGLIGHRRQREGHLFDDGTVFTNPRALQGVPLERITENSEYWEPSWKSLGAYIAGETHQENEKRRWKDKVDALKGTETKEYRDKVRERAKLHSDNVSKQRKIRVE